MNVDECVTSGFLSFRRLGAHAKINLAGDAGISDSFSPDCQLLSHSASPLYFLTLEWWKVLVERFQVYLDGLHLR